MRVLDSKNSASWRCRKSSNYLKERMLYGAIKKSCVSCISELRSRLHAIFHESLVHARCVTTIELGLQLSIDDVHRVNMSPSLVARFDHDGYRLA